ncbi:MAG TPA: 50S ribosomal protein L22 [Candidatus Nanoarchaeia archaeon]|nr:50S ribosomal protein L22 [Candidatus Nanoarchaeia archaeon]
MEYNKEHMAKAIGRALPISTKDSIEICRFIKGKKLAAVKNYLEEVTELKKAIPMRKFKRGIPHRTKMGPGRFPKNAAYEILKILESAEANAQFKGLNSADLIITNVIPNRAATQWHYGGFRGRRMKRTTVEVHIAEGAKEAKK